MPKPIKTLKTKKSTQSASPSGLSLRVEDRRTTPKTDGLSLSVYDGSGKSQGRVSLSKEIFKTDASPALLSQAIRVHLVNNRHGNASTKTRAEVSGGGRKPWRQKGTGRARVGSIRVPHWRGGGVTFGPKPRDFELKFPVKMRRKALFGALTEKLSQKKIVIVSTFQSDGKTKKMRTFLGKLPIENFPKRSILMVLAGPDEKTIRATRNLSNVTTSKPSELNTYQILTHDWLVIEKEAIKKLEGKILKGVN